MTSPAFPSRCSIALSFAFLLASPRLPAQPPSPPPRLPLPPASSLPARAIPDPRHLANGAIIPDQSYCDQPYVVPTADGAWLCVLTTADGHEGSPSQHVVSLRSRDRGLTWSPPVRLEPPDAPENSYAVLLRTPSGRIYCFYNFNHQNLREVRAEDGRIFRRVDTLGQYVFRYSDDHGQSWSDSRYPVPIRPFACDRSNTYRGAIQFFWNVGRPLSVGASTYIPLHKVGAFGDGFLAQSEGAFLHSTNLLHEPDPQRLHFETLPDGDLGLRAPAGGGRIAEEQSLAALSDGTLFCVYRTVDGHPAATYSSDGGRSWTPPAYHAYQPNGRLFKHPRAANFVWRCSNGRFLYWFHNHGGRSFDDRNPAWLCAGHEIETPSGRRLAWSQPEILLYDDDPFIRISYPDLIEEDGAFFLTETQKDIGRVHRLDPTLLAGLFGQITNRTVTQQDLILDLQTRLPGPGEAPMPPTPTFVSRNFARLDQGARDHRAGLTVELWLQPTSLEAGQVILDNRTPDGRGLALTLEPNATLRLSLSDGRSQATWSSDPGLLSTQRLHHVVALVDGGPKIISFLVDGQLNDGGADRPFGWGRFSPHLQNAHGAPALRYAPSFHGRLHRLRLYGRALRTSEAVGNYRAGP